MNKPHRLLGVVLAGGQSSRMGRDKATLPHLDGDDFLTHAIDRLANICDDVMISGRSKPNADNSRSNTRFLADPVAYRGPAVGIATALQLAQSESYDACLFTPVDMPHLTVRDLLMLKQQWQNHDGLTIAFCDAVQPLVGIYPTTLASQIESLAASQHRSLSRWIQTQDFLSVELPASSCQNINTPDDITDGS